LPESHFLSKLGLSALWSREMIEWVTREKLISFLLSNKLLLAFQLLSVFLTPSQHWSIIIIIIINFFKVVNLCHFVKSILKKKYSVQKFPYIKKKTNPQLWDFYLKNCQKSSQLPTLSKGFDWSRIFLAFDFVNNLPVLVVGL
jgi:hypothetical protein